MIRFFFVISVILACYDMYGQDIILRTSNDIKIYHVAEMKYASILTLDNYRKDAESVYKMVTFYKDSLLYVDLSIKGKRNSMRNDIFLFEKDTNIGKIQITQYQKVYIPETSKYNSGFKVLYRKGVMLTTDHTVMAPYDDTITIPIAGNSYMYSNMVNHIFYVTNGGLYRVYDDKEELIIPHAQYTYRRPKRAEGYIYPNLSPDGEKLVFTDGIHALWLLSTKTGDAKELLNVNSFDYNMRIVNPRFSKDNKWILFGYAPGFFLFNVESKKIIPLIQCNDATWI